MAARSRPMPPDVSLAHARDQDLPPVTRALSPLHRAWRWLPAGPRRALLAQGAAWLAPRADGRPSPPEGGVVIAGEVTRASGLGEGARILHAGMGSLGVPSWMVAAGLGIPGEEADEAVATGSLGDVPIAAPLILCVNAPQLPAALLRLPRARLRGRKIVGFWSWELPRLPAGWRPALDHVHEIWVPSAFTAEAVAEILPRVGGPMLRVVPHPLALAPPVPDALERAAFGLPRDAVVVLASFSLASSFARKNPLGAIAAFRAAFGDRPDRILVLKVGKTEHYPDDLATIRAAAGGAPNIRIETRMFGSGARHALTACADIVLSMHRSEGFGLVPAEAMLLGKPVVATGWSGNLEFMDAESAALVDFRLIEVADPRGVYSIAGVRWAEPDVAAAAAHLVRLADDPGACAALGVRGQAMARSRLGRAPLEAALRGLGLLRAGAGGAA